MKTYRVRMEFDVISTDLAEIDIQANSREEAISEAVNQYNNINELDLDYYASDHMETTLSENSIDWIVDEVGE